jgi:hypothetical protein
VIYLIRNKFQKVKQGNMLLKLGLFLNSLLLVLQQELKNYLKVLVVSFWTQIIKKMKKGEVLLILLRVLPLN